MSLFNKKNLSRGIVSLNNSKDFYNFLDELESKLEIQLISTGETLENPRPVLGEIALCELGDVFKIDGKKNLYITVDEEDGDEFKFYFTFFTTENRNFVYNKVKFLHATNYLGGNLIEFLHCGNAFWENEHTLEKETDRIKNSIYNWK